MHEPGADSESIGQSRVKGRNGQLFIQKNYKDNIDTHYRPYAHHCTWDFGPSNLPRVNHTILQRPVENTGWIQLHMLRGLTDKNQADGEKGSEDNAHRSSPVDFAIFTNALCKCSSQQSCTCSPDEHHHRDTGVGQQKTHRDPRKNRMADSIAHHTHPTKDQEASGQGRGHCTEPGNHNRPRIQAIPVESHCLPGWLIDQMRARRHEHSDRLSAQLQFKLTHNVSIKNMLNQIGSVDKIPEYVKRAKDKDDPFRLMGFGHRVYKNYDPRAKVMRQTCHEVLDELGVKDEPLLKLAMELEKIALEDDYFVEKKLYPNVDFYSGIILRAMGFPTTMFTALFALARTVGWIAQWNEMVEDPSQKIGRPRQLYTGPDKRPFVAVDKRG